MVDKWTSGGCYGTSPTWGTATQTLTAGQVVPFVTDFAEASSTAYAETYVRITNGSQTLFADGIVPADWFQTGVRSVGAQHGLAGRYYSYDPAAGTPTFPLAEQDSRLFLTRTDTSMNLGWGTGAPVPGATADAFMVRWKGTFTAPATDTYTFGASTDDGVRIKLGTNETVVLDSWTDHAAGAVNYGNGSPSNTYSLSAGQQLPITVEYYEHDGAAAMSLYLKRGSAPSAPDTIVDSGQLTPGAQVLPDGWNLGIDADGNLSYDYAVIGSGSTVLRDSGGRSHEYKWTGTGFTPPSGEDGQLVRNTDGTLTLADTDGRTYTFNSDGTIATVTTAVDDRNPAALQYAYGGSPSHLTQITDGTSAGRWAKVLYSGDAACPSAPSGFVGAPAGMICAVSTSDGNLTKFFYVTDSGGHFRLARLEHPGGQLTDYGYLAEDVTSPNSCPGCVSSVRDSLANDAIAAGVRTQDATVLTEISYDAIGRASSVTLPAATTGATRQAHSYGYQPVVPTTSPWSRYASPSVGDHMAIVAAPPAGYGFESVLGHLLSAPAAGTHAIYSCLNIGWDEFTSSYSNCEGQTVRGLLGYIYDSPTTGAAAVYRCRIGSDHFDSPASNCEGQVVEFLIGYALTAPAATPASSVVHVAGAAEPSGFSRKVAYDSALRTTTDTDAANLTTTTTWDVDASGNPRKDLVLSTTDPTGLKSSTIYDDEDRATDQYGPVPVAWFGTDRKPTTSYVNQTPHSQTAYDEGIVGPAAAYFDYKAAASGTTGGSLFGAPKLHATGINASPGVVDRTWTSTPITVSGGMQGWGVSTTGKLRLPAGTYSIIVHHTDGARLLLGDQVAVGDWTDGAERDSAEYHFTVTAGSAPIRWRLDGYAKTATTNPVLRANLKQDNGFNWTTNLASYLSPDYSLTTTSKVFDNQLGDITTTSSYGATPELGLLQSATVAGGSVNYGSSQAYETAGASGSFLRKTSKTLPGGNSYTYAYYAAGETRANPCVGGSPAVDQGGQAKLRTEPDPDGAGAQVPRTAEVVRDAAGRIVATRFNADPWTCVTTDSRGRVTQTVLPDISDRTGRTLTANYAVGGNPLVTSSTDSVTGTTTTTSDLFGRAVSSTDTFGYQTTVSRDSQDRPYQQVSLRGTEVVTFDNLSRATSYALDGTTYANNFTYDAYSRLTTVDYPQAQTSGTKLRLSQIVRDNLQRVTGQTFTFADNTTMSETVTLAAQRGTVTADSITRGGQTAGSTYGYDGIGRLTSATVDNWQFAYAFGAQDASCAALAGYNANAHKNGNRTQTTTTNTATSTTTTNKNCYDQADRLLASTDVQIGTPTYDDHGNITQLAGGGTPIAFTYDAADANTKSSRATTGSSTSSPPVARCW
jgi:hypothetical protein